MKTKAKKNLSKALKWTLIIFVISLVAFVMYKFFTQPTQRDPTNTIEVTYQIEGEDYNKQYYAKGDTLQLPRDPNLEGLTFIGWYNAAEEKVSNGLELTEDITLHGYAIKGIGFKFGTRDDTRGKLIDYTGNNTKVIIPSTYSLSHGIAVEGTDYTVTEIDESLWLSKDTTEITIPKTIEIVGNDAFTTYEFIDNVAHRTTLPNLKKVYVNSKAVYGNLTREINLGGLFYTDQVDFYIEASIDDGSNSYLNTQYDKSTVIVNEVEYNLYTFKEEAEVIVSFYKKVDGKRENFVDYDITYTNGSTIGNFPEMPAEYTIYNTTTGKSNVYTFTGTWQDAEGNIVTEETVITGQMSVYAIYETKEEPIEFGVLFFVSESCGYDYIDQVIMHEGDTINVEDFPAPPSTVTYEGETYTFTGEWYCQDENINEQLQSGQVTLYNTVRIFAKYEKN